MSLSAAELCRQSLELAARLGPLAARTGRAGFTAGVHGRRRAGPGEAFWQFRRYQPGDPAESVDWRQSAKSDPLYVREFEWEAARTVWLWADPSASMRWRSQEVLPQKRDHALVLCMALAFLLDEGGERVGILGLDQPPARGRAGLDRLAAGLLAQPADVPPPLPPPGGKGAMMVLISDFLAPIERVSALMDRLAGGAASGQVIRLLDPAERDFPYQGRVLFSGLEGEGEILAQRAEDLRQAYRDRLAGIGETLARAARARSWHFADATTADAPAPLLASVRQALSGR